MFSIYMMLVYKILKVNIFFLVKYVVYINQSWSFFASCSWWTLMRISYFHTNSHSFSFPYPSINWTKWRLYCNEASVVLMLMVFVEDFSFLSQLLSLCLTVWQSIKFHLLKKWTRYLNFFGACMFVNGSTIAGAGTLDCVVQLCSSSKI